MITLTLNDINLKTQYGAVLESFDIGVPSPQLTTIQIPGRNGYLDYSIALTGAIAYDNRTIKCTLAIRGTDAQRETIRQEIASTFSGAMCNIVFSHLAGHFTGRCAISSITRKSPLRRTEIGLTFDCQPFRTLDDGSEIL